MVCVRYCRFLEEQRSHASHFALLLDKYLKVLVDDGHCQEDSCARSDGAQEVSHDRQPSYTEATEGSSCGDVPVNTKYVLNILHNVLLHRFLPTVFLPVELMNH